MTARFYEVLHKIEHANNPEAVTLVIAKPTLNTYGYRRWKAWVNSAHIAVDWWMPGGGWTHVLDVKRPETPITEEVLLEAIAHAHEVMG
jgi:hypothetical protein